MTKLKTIFFAASALALLGVSACKDPSDGTGGDSSGTLTPKYRIFFSVEGGNGTLKAEVDGVKINSGAQEEKDKMVIFTAEPDAGYVLEQWTNAGTVISEAGTKKTYTHTVTANMDIKVKFKEIPNGTAVLTLSPDKLDIKVKVITADGSPVTVEGCTVTTFTSGTETVLHAQDTTVKLIGKITELDCGNCNEYGVGNKLAALNVQGLSALQRLVCSFNQLTALDVQGLTSLRMLDCVVNQLTALNVQGLNDLEELDCSFNQLTALDVLGLTALQWLSCAGNQLTALNVQGLTALNGLVCYDNQLTALDVQGLNALRRLECPGNQLTALNVQGCTALKELWCGDNQLTALAVSGLTALQWLKCWGNRLTALNVQDLTSLQKLECWDNQLTVLNVQGLTALQELYCSGNQLTALNVQGLTALQELYCSGNQLTALNVQGLTALRYLGCWDNQLNADAFKKLFDDLPQRADSDDANCILYTEQTGVTEGNHTDFTAPQDLKDAFNNAKNNKKWKMYKRNGSWPEVEI